MRRYTLAVTSPEYWNEIHEALIVDSNKDGIPDRKITCTDSKNHSPTRGTYELTDEEVEEISKHPHVKWIELSITDYPNVYPKPEPDTKRFRKNVKVYRDLNFNYPAAVPTDTDENRTNWAMKRVGIATNGDSWPNVTGNPGVINTDLSFSLTGKNVDLIIQDSGCLQYHPEFIDDDGKSRVRDVILDGPYYIDPTYFTNNGYTYTKPDGRTGITTTSAHSWWENSGSRSAAFQSLGTIAIPNNYTVANALGIGGTSHTMTSSHGTACASLSGGKNFGLAFESNLWTISIFSPASLNTDNSYDAIKILHQNKPINTATGRKNPTVVNGSWGYFGGFNSGTTVNYSFKGSTGSFTGYNSSSTGVQALAYGLKQGQYYNRQYATSSTSNSVDTAGDEMVEAGVIFVTSAGNSNQRLGIGNTDPHINDYLTSLNGGDSRSGFPSASQSGTKPVGHVKWLHPQRNGYDSVNDIYSSIIVGAMDEIINSDYTERKAFYSNNGPGIDLYAPADETLAAGMRAANGDQLGTETNYARYNSDFVDRYFNGTSAASPVVAGLVALFLESKPDATSAEVKDYLKTHASKVIPSMWQDQTPDDTDANYWRGDYNNRGAASRVLFDPTASDTRPTFANVSGGENIITDQLFLNLDAANYTSGSTWNDSSGNALNATLNGPTFNSNFGGYFDFDGTNDYATLPTLAIAGNELTFSVWNYGIVAQYSGIIFLGDTGDNSGGRILSVHLPYTSNIVYFDKGTTPGDGSSGPNNQYDRINKTATDAQYKGWHHWAFTANATTGFMRIYLDGELWHQDSGKTKTFSNVNGNVRRIGSMYSGSYHRGYISNLQLYKKELSQAEIIHNIDAMKGRFESKPLILSGISYSVT